MIVGGGGSILCWNAKGVELVLKISSRSFHSIKSYSIFSEGQTERQTHDPLSIYGWGKYFMPVFYTFSLHYVRFAHSLIMLNIVMLSIVPHLSIGLNSKINYTSCFSIARYCVCPCINALLKKFKFILKIIFNSTKYIITSIFSH